MERPRENNTINRTLDKAEITTLKSEPFRAIFFLPLTPEKLEKRLEHPSATLLISFPNNTIPFTPDSHWYGTHTGKTGCYNQQNTNLLLIQYENAKA